MSSRTKGSGSREAIRDGDVMPRKIFDAVVEERRSPRPGMRAEPAGRRMDVQRLVVCSSSCGAVLTVDYCVLLSAVLIVGSCVLFS